MIHPRENKSPLVGFPRVLILYKLGILKEISGYCKLVISDKKPSLVKDLRSSEHHSNATSESNKHMSIHPSQCRACLVHASILATSFFHTTLQNFHNQLKHHHTLA